MLVDSAEARGVWAWLAIGSLMSPDGEPLPVLEWFETGHEALVLADELASAATLGCAAADRLLRESRADDARRVAERALAAAPVELELHALLRLTRADALRLAGEWAEAERELARLESELPSDPAAGWERSPDWVRARMHGTRAQVLLEVGLLAEARPHLDQEGRLARALGDPALLLAHTLHRCDLLLRGEDFEGLLRALAGGEAGAADAEATIDRAALPHAAGALLELYEGAALAALARVDEDRAAPAIERLEGCLERQELAPLQRAQALRALADLRCEAGELEPAAALVARARTVLEALPSVPVEAAAQTLACEARVALAADAPAAELARLRDALGAAFRRQLEVWAAVPRPPGGLDFLGTTGRREVAVELVRLTLRDGREGGPERALGVLLDLQARGSVALAEGLGDTDQGALRAALLDGDERGVLAFLPGARLLLVLAVDRSGVEVFEVPGYQTLRRQLQGVAGRMAHHLSLAGRREVSASRRATEIDAACSALGERLLPEPLRARLRRWSRVTIAGAGCLEGVPPEALVLADGRRLGERQAVDEVSTLPLAVHLVRRATAERERARDADAAQLVVLGSLEPAADVRARFPGLWTHDLEPADVAPLLRAFDPRRVRLELDATPERVRALALEDVPLVHVLAHGVFDPHRTRGAALALGSDADGASLFGCEDLERLKLSGLVVLAACGTALGPRRIGEDDLAHLGGAVLAAGARAVVLTRAPLALERSLALFERVHAELRAGSPPAEALRRARAEQPADDPWARLEAAHLQVVGAGHVPLVFGD